MDESVVPYDQYLLERDKDDVMPIQPDMGMFVALYRNTTGYDDYIHLRTHQGSDWATVLLNDEQAYELAVKLLMLIGQKHE